MDLTTVTTGDLVAELESRRQQFGGASIPVIDKNKVIQIIQNNSNVLDFSIDLKSDILNG